MTDTCEIEVERMEFQEILRTNSNASFPKSPIEVETNFSSMMNGHETDLEVGGSVGISVAEERVVGSRRASIAIEESAQKETKNRCAVKKVLAWKMFKSIVFFICLIFLILQSVEFLRNYYKYPTTIELETTLPDDFKLPAITLCFRTTTSFEEFCFYQSNWCEKPSNMEEFCTNHHFHCNGDKSKLRVPLQHLMTRELMQIYLFNDSYNDVSLFLDYIYTSKVRTFVRYIDSSHLYLKCYSQNLHLYQNGSKLETMKLNFVGEKGDLFSQIRLNQFNIEPLYMLDMPNVFFAIHSPYVPLNPEEDLHPVKPGVWYNIYVQLMCQELCRSEYAKAFSGCDWEMTMIPTVRDLCHGDIKRPNLSSEQKDELKKKRLFCFQNCKQGCLKLHYKSKIKEIDDPYYISRAKINFYVKNPEVTVLRHVPVYDSGDVFSHIGGLLGCWLGVSVFTFTNILEKFVRKVVKWKRTFRKKKLTLKRFRKRRFTLRRFRKKKVQRAPQTSEIHQD